MAGNKAQRLTGANPLAYLGVEPLTVPLLVVSSRAPTTKDSHGFFVGAMWVVTPAPYQVWVLANLAGGLATWVELYPSGSAGAANFFTDVAGPAVVVGSNINIFGGANITTDGSIANTVLIEVSGTTNHAVQVGTGALGLTSLAVGTNGQVLLGSTGADPAFVTPLATAGGGGLTLVSNAGSLNYGITAPVSIANGGTNATTMATTDGVVYFDGTRLVTTAVGTAGQVLTSNGAGVAPSFQPIPGTGAIIVTTFNANGTWNKNANTKYVTVIGWNGGSGGGSGRQGTSTNAGGGSGGGNGGSFYYQDSANFFGANETVVIGAGGAGGLTQGAINSDGNVGSVGGLTSFGNLGLTNLADGGGNTTFGLGGAVAGVTGGHSGMWLSVVNQMFSLNVDSVISGGGGSNTVGSNAFNIGSSTAAVGFVSESYCISPSSGGGGSGADTVVIRQAGNGGAQLVWANGVTVLAGGAGGIESGTINGGAGNVGLTTTGGRISGGTGGGGGGGQSAGGVAGTGGVGGVPGGGGGGGGGSINGTTSGTGGTGGAGMVIVIEYT